MVPIGQSWRAGLGLPNTRAVQRPGPAVPGGIPSWASRIARWRPARTVGRLLRARPAQRSEPRDDGQGAIRRHEARLHHRQRGASRRHRPGGVRGALPDSTSSGRKRRSSRATSWNGKTPCSPRISGLDLCVRHGPRARGYGPLRLTARNPPARRNTTGSANASRWFNKAVLNPFSRVLGAGSPTRIRTLNLPVNSRALYR